MISRGWKHHLLPACPWSPVELIQNEFPGEAMLKREQRELWCPCPSMQPPSHPPRLKRGFLEASGLSSCQQTFEPSNGAPENSLISEAVGPLKTGPFLGHLTSELPGQAGAFPLFTLAEASGRETSRWTSPKVKKLTPCLLECYALGPLTSSHRRPF